MTDHPEPEQATPTDRSPRQRWRAVLAGVLGVLAVIGVVASSLAVWARSVLFDSEQVASTVAETVTEPAVAHALAVRVTDEVFTLVDLEGRLSEALPGPLAAFAPTLVGGAESIVSDRLAVAFASDETQAVIEGIVLYAHRATVDLLNGDGLVDGVSVSDGEVSVNLLPLVGRGLEIAQGIGLFSEVDLPELTRDGDPAQQIAALEDATGRDLPDDFGQLVVYRSDSVANAEASVAAAQRLVALFKRAMVVLLLATAALLVAAVVTARQRRRAVIVLALGVVAAVLLVRVAVNRVVARVPDLLVDPGARAAAADALGNLIDGLIQLTGLLVVLGVVVAIAALLTGDSPTARRSRALANGHRDAMAVVAFGAAVGLLVLTGFGWLPFLAALALAAGGAWAMWAPRPTTGEDGSTAADGAVEDPLDLAAVDVGSGDHDEP